jgi:uncharacterized protein with gpF-like domain
METAFQNNFKTLLRLYRSGMTAAQRKRTRHRRPKAPRYPLAIEKEYAKYISNTIGRTSDSAIEMLRPFLMKYVPHMDSVDSELDDIMSRLEEELAMLYGTTYLSSGTLFRTLEQIAEQILGENSAFMQEEIKIISGHEMNLDYSWWGDTKALWEQENYKLITSLNEEYIKKLNSVVISGVQNGVEFEDLVKQIQDLNINMSGARARLIARDQTGKLQGLISKAQQTSIGMTTYFWSNIGDRKVRGNPRGIYPKAVDHWAIGGMLCAWSNSSVYSDDLGVTWKQRPQNWVQMHPGMAIQDRCTAAASWVQYLGQIDKEIA